MSEGDVRTRLLAQFGIRIEPAMCRYVLRRLQASSIDSFPVMGGDARTGVPIRRVIPAAAFDGVIISSDSLVS